MKATLFRPALLPMLVSGFVAGLTVLAPSANQQALAQDGLLQTWYLGNSDSLDDVLDKIDGDDPALDPFVATHGNSWWFGHQFEEAEGGFADFEQTDGLVAYPEGSDPPLELGDDTVFTVEGNQSFNNYTVRMTGMINFPESGTYLFADGIDDYTYLAIDTDKSGTAGDTDDEVFIDDDAWTDADRDRGTVANSPIAEVDVNVAGGGEWLAIEFYMAEGGGHDAGLLYWDYNADGGGLGAGEGFPGEEEAILTDDLEALLVPNTHLCSDSTGANCGGDTPTVLQAGDADEDFDFDQLDLVKVQIAGKYLTGNAATWGEGDWDGAPGGEPGSPPAGNGFFDQLDIIGALNAGTYLTGPYAAVAPGGMEGDGQTSIKYDAGTGEVSVDAPAGVELTSVNIDSAGGVFTGENAANLGGSFDNDADGNIFKATFGGSFGSVSFGNVAQTGLAEEFVLNDLTVVGSLNGGGDLGNVDLIYVPEPSSAIVLILGLASMAISRRRRR